MNVHVNSATTAWISPSATVMPINIDNVTDELPGAVRAWRELGVDCPMISSSTDLIDPDAADAVTLFEAAAAAGVPRIKMGYFKFTPGDSFEELWSLARRRLDGFERLSRRTGVQTMYHTHSGQCLGSNCAGMRHLLQDYDPRQVGAYVDLGHLAINGEDVQIGLAMLRDRLSAIGGKDARHFPTSDPTVERASPTASSCSDKAPPSGPKRSRCSKPGASADRSPSTPNTRPIRRSLAPLARANTPPKPSPYAPAAKSKTWPICAAC